MIDPDEHYDAVHDLLHDGVKSVYASTDLADRVESAAKRRRTARWSATAAIAVIAVGGTIGALAAVHPGTADSAAGRAPTCAANGRAYGLYGRYVSPIPDPQASHAPEPLVSGTPVAAALCRYVEYSKQQQQQPSGALVGSATVTDRVRLDQLRKALDASTLVPHNLTRGCAADIGNRAIVLIAYPGTTVVRTIIYDPACQLLEIDHTLYYAGGDFAPLLTAWTGGWPPPVTY